MSEEIKEEQTTQIEGGSTPPPQEKTQVKTLQQMSLEQGVKSAPPQSITPEQLKANLLLEHHIGVRTVVPAFAKLGKNGLLRLLTAIHQLPQADLDVRLNGDFEKQLYMASQKCLYAKHAIIFSHVRQTAEAERQAMEAKEKADAEKKAQEEASKKETQSSDVVSSAPSTENSVPNPSQETSGAGQS